MLSVAGSGKSTFIVDRLNLKQRFLLITYTENNVVHLRKKIINKFGYEPKNIKLLSYFQFLIRECYRPFLKDKFPSSGIYWKMPKEYTRTFSRENILYYRTKGGLMYHNRIAMLCEKNCLIDIRERIERFYDCFMFDEIQDLGGHDFNLILSILPQNKDVLFVGDFFQHTFTTSSDGNTNRSLYDNLGKYLQKWKKTGLIIDDSTLIKSYRCSPTICEFITLNFAMNMESHRRDSVSIEFVDKEEKANELYADDAILKLFYQDARKYHCFALNWGESKGMDDFVDVCIILNATSLKAYQAGRLSALSPSTRNKLYVACTRAKGNLFFVPHKFIDKFKS